MHKHLVFSIFAEDEDLYNSKLRKLRDKISAPLCRFFTKYGFKPNTLSYLGLLTTVPFVYFFGFHPGIAFIFILINVLFDSIDGPLARFQHRLSVKGAIIDVVCDYLSFFIIFLTFLYYGLLSPFWGAVYLLNYVVMLALVIFCRAMKITFFPVLRSKYYIYSVFLIWLITGSNFFDPFLVLCSVYMVVTNIFLFDRIRCSIR